MTREFHDRIQESSKQHAEKQRVTSASTVHLYRFDYSDLKEARTNAVGWVGAMCPSEGRHMGVQNNGSHLTPRPRTGSTKVKPNVRHKD